MRSDETCVLGGGWRRVVLTVTCLLFFVSSAPSVVALAHEGSDPTADEENGERDQSHRSVAEELGEGIDLLQGEIVKQQQMLKAAQTERERQLIHDHVAFLQQEQRSLTQLLNMLVGPKFDAREAAGEQRQGYEDERASKQLERDERFRTQ